MIENNEIAPYRGGVLPIVRLARMFGIPRCRAARCTSLSSARAMSAVGLAVDRIVGQREMVVRPLEDALVKVDGIVGATDLGDGEWC